MPPPPARPFRPTKRAASNAQGVRCIGCTAPLMELCWHTSSSRTNMLGGGVMPPSDAAMVDDHVVRIGADVVN